MRATHHIFFELIAAVCAAVLALAYAPPASAQTVSEASVVVIGPLSVVKIDDLEFGNIIAGPSSGTVSINTTNGNRTSTGGVLLPSGTFSRADFIIYGELNQIVEVSIPGNITLTHSNGSDTMSVSQMAIGNGNRNFGTFVRGRLSRDGIFNLTVGARLNVGANQTGGGYSGSFTMTVDYQ